MYTHNDTYNTIGRKCSISQTVVQYHVFLLTDIYTILERTEAFYLTSYCYQCYLDKH